MADFKVGPPTKDIPRGKTERSSKYSSIWASVSRLPDDEWLPVEFETNLQAQRFASTIYNKRDPRYNAKTRGKIVYLREQRAKKVSRIR